MANTTPLAGQRLPNCYDLPQLVLAGNLQHVAWVCGSLTNAWMERAVVCRIVANCFAKVHTVIFSRLFIEKTVSSQIGEV